MSSFIVFGVVALISIIFLTAFLVKYQKSSFWGWLGSLLMVLSAVAYIAPPNLPIFPAVQIAYGIGVIFYFIGIYLVAVRLGIKHPGGDSDDRAKTISDILEVAASRDSLIELLNYSLDRFLEVFSLNSGAIHIFQRSRNILVMGAYRGLIPAHAKRLELIEPGNTAIGRAVQNKRVLIIRDLRVSPDYQFFGGRTEGYSFLAVAPVIVEGECWGVITLMGRKKYTRGLLDIDLLEQFGYKLGQALALGRENRRMRTEYGRLELVNSVYNQLCQTAKSNISKTPVLADKDIFAALNTGRLQLFDNKPYAILKYANNKGECLFLRNARGAVEIVADTNKARLTSIKPPATFRPGEGFTVGETDLAGLVPSSFIGNKRLAAYGYSYQPDFIAVVVANELDAKALQGRTEDLLLIGNLLTLSFLAAKTLSIKSRDEADFNGEKASERKELISLLFNILGEVESLKSQVFGSNDKQSGRVIERLKDVESAAMRGINMIEKASDAVNPNTIIQSVLERNHMDIAFYPGINLTSMQTDLNEFADTVETILKEAISDNKRLRLKTSKHNGLVALTIEGQVDNNFPSPRTLEKARRHNIDLNVIRQTPAPMGQTAPAAGQTPLSVGQAHSSAGQADNPELPADLEVSLAETSAALKILTIENKPVITELLENFFEQMEYVNKVVALGKDGLELVRKAEIDNDRFDVVIIDMTLDDISGLELCRKIKQIDRRIYSVIISGWGINIHNSTLEDAGVDAVLHKPFRLEQLKKVLPKKGIANAAENQ